MKTNLQCQRVIARRVGKQIRSFLETLQTEFISERAKVKKSYKNHKYVLFTAGKIKKIKIFTIYANNTCY